VSDEPEMVIPLDRLPPGFAERVADPPADAAPPKPAATAVLLRDGDDGPELLLLRRLRSAGFVPGAFVFPGGRVDDADADPALVALLDGHRVTADDGGHRNVPAAFWLATIREVFEETGVLLARPAGDEAGDGPGGAAGGAAAMCAAADPRLARWRGALLEGTATLLDVLHDLQLRPDTRRMVYCAHWITPVAEPKRYDTRFFLAALPPACEATIDEREMSEAAWITPAAALERFRRGTLPMVFPTVKTIQRLAQYRTVDAMLDAFRAGDIPAILPRLVRTGDGVGIVMPDEGG
jgi:8-oxo-dGTP pyrophosphatase MutT (NUDIX family)